MEADRTVNLKSYAWLTALAMLLALFVPLASAGAQDTGPDGDTLSAQEVEEEGGTLDATPESDTTMVAEVQTITVRVEDGDGNAAEGVNVTGTVDDPAENSSYDGGLQDGTSENCTTDEDGVCELFFNEASDEYPAPESGKDRIRVVQGTTEGTAQAQAVGDHDFVTVTWVTQEDAADAERLGAEDRIATAVEISKDHWLGHDGSVGDIDDDDPSNDDPTFSEREKADAVVLARADNYPDSLAGTPLAKRLNGPQLLTFPQELDERTEDEIQRLLDPDGTKLVFILGGTDAISQTVEDRIKELGYEVNRLGGEDRFQTAVLIAQHIEKSQADNANHIFITRSHEFPDALAAGAAAANVVPGTNEVGVIVLTPDTFKQEDTEAYLNARQASTTYALAGPRFNPYACEYEEDEPTLTQRQCADQQGKADWTINGWDRYETARAVAEFFFDGPTQVGVARGDKFPDALTGGAHIAQFNGPIVLTAGPTILTNLEDDDARRYLCYTADTIAHGYVYGEFEAISDTAFEQADDAIDGTYCRDYDEPGEYITTETG